MNENDRVKVYNDDLASTGMPQNLFRGWHGWGFYPFKNKIISRTKFELFYKL
jgi:hypothetical protein